MPAGVATAEAFEDPPGIEPLPAERSLIERAQDRVRLLMALQEEGLLPEGATVDAQSVPEATPEFIAAVHGYLARTPCWLAAVQIEDAIGQLEQVNVPGTTRLRGVEALPLSVTPAGASIRRSTA